MFSASVEYDDDHDDWARRALRFWCWSTPFWLIDDDHDDARDVSRLSRRSAPRPLAALARLMAATMSDPVGTAPVGAAGTVVRGSERDGCGAVVRPSLAGSATGGGATGLSAGVRRAPLSVARR